jgi:G3E family GTPase
MADINQDGRIPITLLTGFLGAGKTTMLNRLLSDPDSGKIAVIVNEFGEIGIDGDLIVRRNEEMMELSNGCICCDGKDDLVGALYSLYKKKLGLEGEKIDFDRVVIETTGLADPAPLAQLFFTDMNLSLTFKMDAIVTMVDLANVMTQISQSIEAKKQIAISDKLILNKRDLVTEEAFNIALKKIRLLCPFSPIEITANANLNATQLLDLGLFNPIQKEAAISIWLGEDHTDKKNDHNHQHHHHHNKEDEACSVCATNHVQHLEDITAISIREEMPLSYDKLIGMLSELVEIYGDNLYRVKGLVRFSDQDRPVIVQGVQKIFSPLVFADQWPQNIAETRLVLIGKGLDRELINSKFSTCIAPKIPFFDKASGAI